MIEIKQLVKIINPERTNADAVIREIYKYSRYELYQQSHAGWQMRTRT